MISTAGAAALAGIAATVMQRLPATPGATGTPGGVGVFLTVDLLRAPFVPAPILAASGGKVA